MKFSHYSRFLLNAHSLNLFCATLVLTGLSCTAFALNDDGQGNPLSSLTTITDFIGITKKVEVPEIDYRERPTLVLPPKYDLPQPQTSDATKSSVWPNDPDIAKRKSASVVNQTPIINTDSSKVLSKQELMASHNNSIENTNFNDFPECGSVSKKDCNWINPDVLKAEHLQKSEGTENLIAGYEPPRLNLIDPPKGYRLATKTTKVTTEPFHPHADPANPTTTYRTDPEATGEDN